MNASVVFDPLLPWVIVWGLAALGLAVVALAAWLRSPAWALRALAFAVLIAALANPAFVRELRRALPDVAYVLIDETESQTIDDRAAETEAAEASILADLEALAAREPDAPIETRVIRVRNEGGPVGDPGSALLTALSKAAADAPPDRIAGAILVTDGQIHDQDALTE
ncbi:MAG: hypothetical protein AAGF90_22425, partial [Pseudomonadota bacterium]